MVRVYIVRKAERPVEFGYNILTSMVVFPSVAMMGIIAGYLSTSYYYRRVHGVSYYEISILGF